MMALRECDNDCTNAEVSARAICVGASGGVAHIGRVKRQIGRGHIAQFKVGRQQVAAATILSGKFMGHQSRSCTVNRIIKRSIRLDLCGVASLLFD